MQTQPVGFSTETLAAKAEMKAQSLRAAFCRDGHWCGIVPKKLPNKKLWWPADAVNALLSGSAK
jgi:hypothetical protein